jgi:hypothetical protein
MTKVQLSFKLSRPLSDDDLKQISRVHAVFGILAVRVPAAANELFVEYDASRLSLPDVKGTLERHGIPLQ